MPAVDRQSIKLSDGVAEAVVLPWLGAGLERYDLTSRGRREPLFRTAPEGTTDPFALASIVLAPWSNRISGGGFLFGGAFHQLAANVPGEPFPIHGNGFFSPWRIKDQSSTHATFSLSSNGPGPFFYDAEMSYALSGGALAMKLTVANRSPISLPYGFGFHPWLPRTKDVLLAAPAKSVWLEDRNHLPTDKLKIAQRPEWDFSTPRPLPAGWINNAFDSWKGRAEIIWPNRSLALGVETSSNLGVYIVYSPDKEADFFCFEPVSHPVDAHNLGHDAGPSGLIVLAPREQAQASCSFTPQWA